MKELLEKYFSAIRDFLPEKEAKPSIGLDIGSASCKAVELILKDNTYTINKWAIEPIESGREKEAVKKILGQFDIEQRVIFTAVSGQGTLTRYIMMPRMPEEDLKKSFKLEIDKYFPFAKDQIYSDCNILDSKGKDNKISVLIAAAKKEIIDKRVKFLSEMGVQIDYVGLTTVALINVYNSLKFHGKKTRDIIEDFDQKKATAILDMGDTSSNLIVLEGNLPLFTRHISVGGRELDKRISNVLGIKVEEAKMIKCDPGKQRDEILNACESLLMNLVSDVRLSFDYFVTENNIQVTKLLLTGGASLLEGLEEFFKKNLEVPVEIWSPVDSFELAEGQSTEELNKNINRLIVAIGLALNQND